MGCPGEKLSPFLFFCNKLVPLHIKSKHQHIEDSTQLKKFKGANTLWQIAAKTDIPSFDTNIQKN